MSGAHVAIHAAHEQQRKNEEEEEKMTQYTSEDLDNNWEFKIVRSTFGKFRKPEHIQAVIEEEAQAGWVMVEKFDDNRIRFKRSNSARKNDPLLPTYVDPYRTNYDRISGNSGVMIGVGILIALLLAGVAVALFVGL